MKKLILSLLLCLAVLTGCQPGEINETIYFDQIGDNVTDAHKVQDLYVVNLWADSSNISGGGGGNITGPLASTDNAIVRWDGVLGNALQDYTSNPPTISDTGDMDIDGDIASDSLITNYIDMSEAVEPASPAANNMRMFALDEHGYSVLSYKDAGGMVRQFMRDSVFIAYNDTGSTIAAGRIVYAIGSTGTVPEIALAKADSSSTMPAIGVTIERLLHGEYGRVMQIGLLEDVNTSAYSAGDVLWVSETTAGIPTATQPTAPHISQEIGTILVDNAVTGAIQIVARSRIAFGVSDNNTVQVDDTSVNATELAKWTAYGLEGYAQSGSTFPTNPVAGDLFLHTPTGRNILYEYDGTNWGSIISIGTMTVYVDATDGTDNVTQGTGVDGDAFATVQYAVNTIPPLFSGHVYIYINAEAYNESVDIRGKSPTGSYSIYIYGTLVVEMSGTHSINGVQGTGATQGSFTDSSSNLSGTENLLCYLDSDGDYRVIDSANTTSVNVTGCFSSQPLSGENYVIYDWGTEINNIDNITVGLIVYIRDIKMTTSYTMYNRSYSDTAVLRCAFDELIAVASYARVSFDTCYATSSHSWAGTLYASVMGRCTLYRSKIEHTAGGGSCVFASHADVVIAYGTILDGETGVADDADGLYAITNSAVIFSNSVTQGYCHIRNCDDGIDARTGGQVAGTANNQYSGNDTDENAAAASYGYID